MQDNDILSSVQNRVMSYIRKYKMIQPGQKIVVGVSGGPDSSALLHVLMSLRDKLDAELIVAHVEHGMRAQQSVEDAQYVISMAQRMGLSVYVKHCDVPSYAKEHGLSQEQAGRIIRYDFFRQICKYRGCNSIAVAHNKDDNAETILLHILRGSGLDGLVGIRPVRGDIIRPLLDIPRIDIEAYCAAAGMNPRRDYTNDDPSYMRNRIRLKLIPFLSQNFNPNIVDSLVRMSHILSDDNEFLSTCVEAAFKRSVHIDDDIAVLHIPDFKSLHKALQRRLLRYIISKLKGDADSIEYLHIEQLMVYIEQGCVGQKLTLPADIMAERGNDKVYIYLQSTVRIMSEPFCRTISVPGDTYVKNGQAILSSCIIDKSGITDYNSNVSVAYMDADKVYFPIYIRNRRPGDRFMPIGSSGHKKLKEYFIDEKVPRIYRDSIPLIASDHEILWVIGHRLSDTCKVNESTRRVLRLTYKTTGHNE
ncbi:MAG: tRNA(Ile)-lysidine synthase [Clostridiales bacterium]|nr:tRNA(Ile)-lysidine synthase [Clostridiales bacterium]